MTDVLPPAAVRRIVKELSQLRAEPVEGVRVVLNEENVTQFGAWVEGPEGTPYAGGYFRIRFSFTNEYPTAPPKCHFVTKIFHPNVSKQGDICVDTLKKGWKKEMGIGHILTVIRCLLIYPNPESALDEEAGRLLLEAYEDYCKHAKLFTSIHATPKVKPVEFTTSSDSSAQIPSSSISSKAPTSISPSVSQSPTIPPSYMPLQSTSSAAQQENMKTLPAVSGANGTGGAVVKKPVVSQAKRGLKRL